MWRDTEEEPPLPNDREAMATDPRFLMWLRARLRAEPELTAMRPHPAALEHALDWLLEDPMDYVVWRPETEYRGPGYAAGAWVIRRERVVADFREAVRAGFRRVAREKDAAVLTSLDDWLRADAAGTLHYCGAPGGSVSLDEDTRAALARARSRRLPPPRACGDCGESFRPTRANARRCPACLAHAKAHRTKSTR